MNISEETLKEGTVLMCGYLEFKAIEGNAFIVSKEFLKTIGNEVFHIKQCKFHSDWNWLHALIEEINSSYAECNLLSCYCHILDNGYNEQLWYMGGEVIENVFCAITDYLKWLAIPHEPSASVTVDESEDLPF